MASSLNTKWFTILRMAGAVTTSNSGTSSLFNNKSIGGKKRGKKKPRKNVKYNLKK